MRGHGSCAAASRSRAAARRRRTLDRFKHLNPTNIAELGLYERPSARAEIVSFTWTVFTWLWWPLISFITLWTTPSWFRLITVAIEVLRLVIGLQIFIVVRALRYVGGYRKNRKYTSLLNNVQTYSEYAARAESNESDEVRLWRTELESAFFDHENVVHWMKGLMQAQEEGNHRAAMDYVRAAFHREHLHLNDARLYAVSPVGSKELVEAYHSLFEESCYNLLNSDIPKDELLDLFKRGQSSVGQTVLCLSGGGSLAMYHVGVVRTLHENGLLPNVVSGSSGGSIVAAYLAICNDQELEDAFTPTIVQKHGKTFFRPTQEQIMHFVRYGIMMDNKEFYDTCRSYYGDWTFREAFEHTGREVTITVTRAHRSGTAKPQVVMLNHINSPDVLLASAVTCTCCCPGLMHPHELHGKDKHNRRFTAFPGEKFLDGSLSGDLPRELLARQFRGTQFIISQVNPYVVPFAQHGDQKLANATGPSGFTLDVLEHQIMGSMKYHMQKLCKLNVIPKIFNQDISGVFEQEYEVASGSDVYIYPSDSVFDNFKILQQPDLNDMKLYIHKGKCATWPKLSHIRSWLLKEQVIDHCVAEINAHGRVERRSSFGSDPSFSRTRTWVDTVATVLLQDQHGEGDKVDTSQACGTSHPT